MKCRVHFTSPKGNAADVAEAIARVAKQPKEALLPAYLPEAVPLMFLGCEESGGKIDKTMKQFLISLDKSRVVHAALFTTSPKGTHATADAIKADLQSKGIIVMDEILVTNGKGGLFQGGKAPTEEDFDKAQKWAQKQIDVVTAKNS